MKQEDQAEINNNFQTYQEQLLLLHHHHQQQHQIMMQQPSDHHAYGGGGFNMFPSDQVSPWSIPFNHQQQQQQEQGSPPFSSFFNNRSSSSSRVMNIPSLQFASSSSYDTLVHHNPFVGKMSAQEIMEAKALAASKSHSEAERRRRERINNHLAKLRSLLPSTTKTDKASLLAEVIQHVKELKRQTSLLEETSPVPTESDELTVDASDEDGRFVIKASLCCEDRSDLLPELIKALKELKLRTLKADITTLGGRVKNVLFITAEEEYYSSSDDEHVHGHYQQQQYCISSIQEALKAVMEKSVGNESASATTSASVKRQRTNMISIS